MIPILNSKLLIPDVSEAISRERLDHFLERIPQNKLTTVVACAGYGKTTLVAQAVHKTKWNTVWYRLGESDRDLVTFISYLVTGLRKLLPSFGKETESRLSDVQDPQSECEEILTFLISEIERSDCHDLFIVLEDFHRVQESREIGRALTFLLDNQPPSLHLVIIGRLEPDLPLSRLRSNGEIVEIKTEDLVFSDRETDRLCRKLFGASPDEESLKALRRKTEGWVVGLMLFYRALKNKDLSEIELRIARLRGSSDTISAYLRENAFENLPEATKDFLVKTAILSRLDADFCNHYLKTDKAGAILSQLERSRLFTFSLEEEEKRFRYHRLFQEFLIEKLEQESGRTTVMGLQLVAAKLYEQRGRTEEALDLYISAEDFESACNLAKDAVNVWRNLGRFRIISRYFDRIPQHHLQKQSWYKAVKTQLTTFSGNYAEALGGWENIRRNPDRKSSSEEIHWAQFQIAAIHFETGNGVQAESEFKALLVQKGLPQSIRMVTLRTLVFIAYAQKRIKDADSYLAEFNNSLENLDLPPKIKEALESYVECRKHFLAEEYAKALPYGERVIELDKGFRGSPDGFDCYYWVSLSHGYQGHYAKGLEIAQQGLRFLEETESQTVRPPEFFLIPLAINAIGLGEIETGIAQAEKGLRFYMATGLVANQTLLHTILCTAYRLSGDLSLAEKHIQNAIKTVAADHPTRLGFETALNHLFIEQGRTDRISRLWEESGINRADWRLLDPGIMALQAHYFWAIGKKVSALKRFQHILKISRNRNRPHDLLTGGKSVVQLLVETYAQGKFKPYIRELLSRMAAPWALEELKRVSSSRERNIKRAVADMVKYLPTGPPSGLFVNFLGKFGVQVGDEAIPDERWKSQKAKTLFKYLVFKRTRGFTSKDLLMEFLWPEEDPKKTVKRLHMALASLRKILEPDNLPGTVSSYIIREGDGYAISLGDNGRVDFEVFSDLMKSGREADNPDIALHHFKLAESVYQGDFLEEDPYAEWCIQARDRYRDDYLLILAWLMDYYETAKNYDSCIDYAEKHLAVDAYTENVYRRLMRFHQKNKTPERVIHIYQNCKNNLAEGLDCSVSPETEKMYQQIVQQLGS